MSRVIGTVVIFQVTQTPPPICDMTKIPLRRNFVIAGPHVASIVVMSYEVVCLWIVPSTTVDDNQDSHTS